MEFSFNEQLSPSKIATFDLLLFIPFYFLRV
jgi:hypothetical protein